MEKKKGSKRIKKQKIKKKKDTLDEDDDVGETEKEEKKKKDEDRKGSSIKKKPASRHEKKKVKEVTKGKAPSSDNGNCSLKKFVEDVKAIKEKGGFQQYFESKLSSYCSPKTGATVWSENMSRNRSKTIPCYDHSRIKIEKDETNKSGYIHANLMEIDDFDRKYILTQFPLPETFEDFWSLIFENEVETVLSIFNPLGDSDIFDAPKKAATTTTNQSKDGDESSKMTLSQREAAFDMRQAHLEIAKKSVRCPLEGSMTFFPTNEGNYMTIGRYFVHTRKIERPERADRPTIFTIEVLPEGCSECRFVRIANVPNWDAKSFPIPPRSLLTLIRAITLDPLQKGPVVVHCDFGVDRSAAVVLTDVLITRVLSTKNVEIEEIFKQFRNSRANCFQQSNYFTYSIFSALFYFHLRFKSSSQYSPEFLLSLKTILLEMKKCFPQQKTDELMTTS